MDAIRFDVGRWWRDPDYREFIAAVAQATQEATAGKGAAVPPLARRAA